MKKFVEFLFEIGCEEIPARMQLDAEKNIKDLFLTTFNEYGISFEDLESFITPRRQVIKANISAETKEVFEERRGPKVGSPENAIDGFLKSIHIKKEELIQSNGYFYAHIKKPSQKTEELLPSIFEKIFKSMQWPKVMRYPGASIPWVRPIRSILCLLDQKSLTLSFDYLGLSSTNKTVGHRFMGNVESIISTTHDYLQFLKNEHVVLNHQERQNLIKQDLLKYAESKNIEWVEDQSLLEEVAGLIEYPFVYIGEIAEKFMRLPSSVLATSMKVHQKYFVFKQKENDQLAPFFGVVANSNPVDSSIMMQGFQKVLNARLTDAAFFFDIDVKTSLFDLSKKLEAITYHNQLGSLKDKLDRMASNSFFEQTKSLTDAIYLSKSDLLTQMVSEFAELQGKMGHIYAKAQGIETHIAIALEEYYLPQGPKDPLPSTFIGSQLSLLDKMDALVGFLKIGLKPSGSKDPFALRRQALGIIRILLSDAFKCVDLSKFIESTHKTYNSLNEKTISDVKDFILERFLHLMKDEFSTSIVTSVLNTLKNSSPIYLYSVKKRLEALSIFLQSPSGDLLKALHKRATGIVDGESGIIQENLFENDYERDFYKALIIVEEKIDTHLKSENFTNVMVELSTLQKEMSLFFDNVLINSDNEQIKQNRKFLIKRFLNNILAISDFSFI